MIKIKFWVCDIGREDTPYLDEAIVDSLENAEEQIKKNGKAI